jgi:hypothetical protein
VVTNLYVEDPVLKVSTPRDLILARSRVVGIADTYAISKVVPPVKSIPFLIPNFENNIQDATRRSTEILINIDLYLMMAIPL